MKTTKKVFAALLALVMMLAMTIPAFADDPAPAVPTGSITITNAISDPTQTYNAYKIFDLSYDKVNGAYRYQLIDDWAGFFQGVPEDAEEDPDGYDYSAYFVFDKEGYILSTTLEADSDTMAQMAKDAVAYAKANGITAHTATVTGTNAVISDLELGYYAVDSTVGTICMLDTAEENITIVDKNDIPSVDKVILEDGEEKDENSVSIGDVVNYQVTIDVKKGAKNYVLHDTMTEGLTFNNNVAIAGLEEGADKDYTVVTECADGCTFEIVFTEACLNAIDDDTADFVVTYSATLNENAVIAGDGNTNTTFLKYGNNVKSNEDEVTTYTYSFDIVKTDADNKLLEGAIFQVLTDEDDADSAIYFVETADGYKVAAPTAAGATKDIPAGNVTLIGLEGLNTTYYVLETQAPDGYNRVYDAVAITITNQNDNATIVENTWTNGGVHVVNQKGTELPSTGGIGTTIFYVAGGVLVVAAVIFLVTRRKANVEEA